MKYLYYKKYLSTQQIADLYKIPFSSTIFAKFRKYNIPLRSVEESIRLSTPRRANSAAKSLIKLPRNPFSNNILEKAYLLGFTMGDLHVDKRKYGETIYVGFSTTKKDQLDLIKSLFERYSLIRIHSNKYNNYQSIIGLDKSFEFLLQYKKKRVPKWVFGREKFLHFLAGYIDAEGHFGVPNNVGQFIIASYDKHLLFEISKILKQLKIDVEGPKLEIKKGFIDKRGVRCNGDLWKIRIKRMKELYRFISLVKPYIRHKKRYNDMMNVEKNLLSRTTRIDVKGGAV